MSKQAATTFVALVMDNSGSMGHIKREAAACLNTTLASLRDKPLTKAGVFRFGFRAEVVHEVSAIGKVKDVGVFPCNENTALYDGIGFAIEKLQEAARVHKKRAEFLLVVFTDGEENASKTYSRGSIQTLLKTVQDQGNWTVAVNVPPNARMHTSAMLGIPLENIREWEGTSRGMIETQVHTVSATNAYFEQKKANPAMRSSTAFYVQTDMSKVATAAVKQKLDDMSDRFKAYDIKAEVVVKDFVEAKLKQPYVVGQAYYLLMKAEKVQPNKQVLIQEKGKQAVWGGPSARELIGLPANAHAKVTPGNHSNYDIYVQSASVNRKLPRGTKILVDTKLSMGITPTWDHTAAPVVKK